MVLVVAKTHSNRLRYSFWLLRDLHTSNILLTESFDAKVADFGLSQTQGGVMEKRVIYQRIMPPEVLRGEVYAKASDVYMFGLVLLELLTRRKVSKDFITGESFRMLQEFYSEVRRAESMFSGK
jgi:serine/threonine protein kinase